MSYTLRHRWRLGLLAVLAICSSCTFATVPETNLAEAEARWAQYHPMSYEITMQRTCFCPTELTDAVIVTVRNGAIESQRYQKNGVAVFPQFAASFPAVDGLFAIIDNAAVRHADKADVIYHPVYAFPERINIDYVANAADDELLIVVSAFKPL